MTNIVAKRVDNSHEWESFILNHPESNFLQSHLWGDFQERLNKKVFRIGLYNNSDLCGVFLSIVENAKRAKYMTIAGGPILDWNNEELVNECFAEIKRIAKEEKCVFVRIRPQLIENEYSTNLFKKNGFRKSPMHLTAELTHELDISLTEEELFKNLRKTTRNEIKKAIEKSVRIESTTDPKAIDEFYEIQMQTAKFHKFVPFSHKFLQEQFRTFAGAGHAVLYKAYFEDKLLALAFVIFYGAEAAYHYGASTQYGREYPGAYLIQWESIKEAKKRGIKRYNFWGVAPEGQKDHRFHGVSVFKRGFGGQDVQYLHAQDLVIDKIRYIPNYYFEHLRKRIRKV